MNKTSSSNEKILELQEGTNDLLLDLMCLTTNKEEMKKHIDAYILSNNTTKMILETKADMNRRMDSLDNE